jgi:hypothetical protein
MGRDQAKFDPSVGRLLTPVLDNYAKLLTMYKDSAAVWGAELEKKKGGDLSAIAVKYGASSAIREEPQAIGSYHYKETVVDYEAIRQTIWEQAGKLHEGQIAIVYGYPLEGAKTK